MSRRLPPEVKFYQRLLARDPDEATELAEEYLEERIPSPSCMTRSSCRRSGWRSRTGCAAASIGQPSRALPRIRSASSRIWRRSRSGRRTRRSVPTPALAKAPPGRPRSCASARGTAWTRPLRRCWRSSSGRTASTPRTLSRKIEVAGRNLARLERRGVALICLSYINPAATQHAHRLTRRLRQHFGPEVRIMVGLWSRQGATGRARGAAAHLERGPAGHLSGAGRPPDRGGRRADAA